MIPLNGQQTGSVGWIFEHTYLYLVLHLQDQNSGLPEDLAPLEDRETPGGNGDARIKIPRKCVHKRLWKREPTQMLFVRPQTVPLCKNVTYSYLHPDFFFPASMTHTTQCSANAAFASHDEPLNALISGGQTRVCSKTQRHVANQCRDDTSFVSLGSQNTTMYSKHRICICMHLLEWPTTWSVTQCRRAGRAGTQTVCPAPGGTKHNT